MTPIAFLSIRSNTHKIEGLLKDYGLEKNMTTIESIGQRIKNEDYITPNIDTKKISLDIENMIEEVMNV